MSLPAERAQHASRLRGRVAIVSGAAGGIGQAVGRRFVQEGAGVVLGDLDGEACTAAAAELNELALPGKAVGAQLDVTQPGDWARAVQLARRRFGYPNVLVNNAGTVGVHGVEGVTEPEWARVVDVCQRGIWPGAARSSTWRRCSGWSAPRPRSPTTPPRARSGR
jgi:cyclopentanol dehydrogenase